MWSIDAFQMSIKRPIYRVKYSKVEVWWSNVESSRMQQSYGREMQSQVELMEQSYGRVMYSQVERSTAPVD